jgi:hypothetical protein
VLCEVKNEEELNSVAYRLEQNCICFEPFFEPDIGNQITAIASGPVYGDTRRLFKRYRLFCSLEKENCS